MATYPVVNVAAVDCQKQVRSWQLFRSLIEFLIPTCNCAFTEDQEQQQPMYYSSKPISPPPSTANSVTGTIFGYRRGKVNFCIQTNSSSTNPILLLELAVPTAILAREMRGGVLRIALESATTANSGGRSVLSSPAWSMYFNGRKVGYGLRRGASAAEVETLRRLGRVAEGAGVIEGEDDYLMYLRGNFDRVCGASGDSESFHLRDPNGSIGQELSIFFFRSK
ncbi:protein MIZU-KUSSEI 1 [Cucumis sativus]|uniref:Protein MIZU-KUSSEI 1 n=1 Tax=Cucumis sativus TaxID=3659 RepID=A0A0A0KG77_CUCSA|nr:protein MIZU-KUSSEI 1 [Cucumis sativus]KGN48725.1 hypothetical protein Csa_003562 [Cucumis sativus]